MLILIIGLVFLGISIICILRMFLDQFDYWEVKNAISLAFWVFGGWICCIIGSVIVSYIWIEIWYGWFSFLIMLGIWFFYFLPYIILLILPIHIRKL